MFGDKEYPTYWVYVKPEMTEGMTGGYEVEFDNYEDALSKYDSFADEYNEVSLIEEKHVVSKTCLKTNVWVIGPHIVMVDYKENK